MVFEEVLEVLFERGRAAELVPQHVTVPRSVSWNTKPEIYGGFPAIQNRRGIGDSVFSRPFDVVYSADEIFPRETSVATQDNRRGGECDLLESPDALSPGPP